MGLGFTIDTPIKVAPYGISSVISIVDDSLIERMREFYSGKLGIPYVVISDKTKDYRAERITSYLNMVDEIVRKKFAELKDSINTTGEEIHKYFEMLPELSELKLKFNELVSKGEAYKNELINWVHDNISLGSIDVNIMTKLDSVTFFNKEKLPSQYNDAHAALRGFALSNLSSSLVLSAGINPSLYTYIESFEDFYPDEKNQLKKKLILKVSDFRSAMIQGKFLAKKGLWVSEYRIESGLNCGGHAFATDGFMMGPILEEFKNKREELIETTHKIFSDALKIKNRYSPTTPLNIRITAQGGVGTSAEHEFLLDYYGLDSVGWGTPFLLVPEVVNIDKHTMEQLKDAKEDDLYLSKISPLGVPFNSLRDNSQDLEKQELIEKGRPGSSCPKKYLTFNTEYTVEPICTASRQYQHLKIKELDEKNLDEISYKSAFSKIVDKACICVGLSNPALHVNNLDFKGKSRGVSVCPGPNMAYFDKTLTLKEMIDHIYGRINVMSNSDRPHMFIKELKLYISYLKSSIEDCENSISEKQEKYFNNFMSNMNDGIEYYKHLFEALKNKYSHFKDDFNHELERLKNELAQLLVYEENSQAK
jgi:gas vesicle protein